MFSRKYKGDVVTVAFGHSLRWFLLVGWGLSLSGVTADDVRIEPAANGKWPAVPRGTASAVTVISNLAYVSVGDAGLQILDVTDPTRPFYKGGFDGRYRVGKAHVSGDHAYLAGSRFQIVDVKTPASCHAIPTGTNGGSQGFGFQSSDVYVESNRAYIVQYPEGLHILDLSVPTNVVLLSRFGTGAIAASFQKVGNLIYIANGGGGVLVVDVSDPRQPRMAARSMQATNAQGVFVRSNYVYVADNTNGLQILQITSPTTLTRVGGARPRPLLPNAARVQVVGDVAYVADRSSGLHAYDVRDPANPSHVFREPAGYNAEDLEVHPPYVFVADSARGLRIHDITTETNPVLIGTYSYEGETRHVSAVGPYVYVADHAAGLHVVDVSNPAQPSRVGGHYGGLVAWVVRAIGNRAYVSGNQRNALGQGSIWALYVFDISSPTEPAPIGSIYTTNVPQRIEIADSHAYLPMITYGLMVVDIHDPTNLMIASRYTSISQAWDVRVANGLAYVADGDFGLKILNAADPGALTELGRYAAPGHARQIDVHGHILYCANGAGGLEIVDVSVPANPTRLGRLPLSLAQTLHAVQVVGTRAFLAGNVGLMVADVSDPTQPVVLTRSDIRPFPENLLVDEKRIFLAQGEYGFALLVSLAQQQFTLRVTGPTGAPVTIQGSSDLTTGNWADLLSTNLPSTPLYFSDPDVQQPARFYRVRP